MTAAAPETPATPGQAAYEAYLAHLQGADPGYGQWVKPFAAIDKHDRDAWEAAAIAARQPQTAPGDDEPNAAFTAWAEANKIDPLGMDYAEYGADALRDAFAAGMNAAQPAPEPFLLRLNPPTPEQIAAWRAELDDPEPAPGDASGLLEPLHALAAKWDATAARNQRNGQSLVDQGDEYGSEGLAIAEALGACVVDLRAVLADAPEPQPAPDNGERPVVYARFLRASYPALPDHQVTDAWRSADVREVAFWRDVEAKVIPAECRTPGCCNNEEASR